MLFTFPIQQYPVEYLPRGEKRLQRNLSILFSNLSLLLPLPLVLSTPTYLPLIYRSLLPPILPQPLPLSPLLLHTHPPANLLRSAAPPRVLLAATN